MNRPRPVVVAYDISENRLRAKIYKILKQWRLGGQKSVHECRLKMSQAEELFLQLSEPLDEKKDRLLMVWLESHRPVLCRGSGKSNIRQNIFHVD